MRSSLCGFVLTMAVAVPAAAPLPAAPQVTVSSDIKQIKLSWPASSQQRYLKAQNPGLSDHFGGSVFTAAVAVSADAATIAVPAGDEDGSGVGVPGTPQDDAASNAGGVYLY